MEERPSSAIEDYLRAISGQTERGESVTNTSLSQRLGVSPSSVSGMLTKLSHMGLITHERYRSVALTERGQRLANDVLRRHRLVELFLVEMLDYTWDEVHVEADALEHAVSDDLVAHISRKLGHPTVDPHGDPIPSAEGVVAGPPTQLLGQLEPGTIGTIARVWDTDSDLLRYLTDHGLTLGTQLEVVEQKPFGGPIVVRVGEETHFLGQKIAETLLITVEG